MNRPPLEIRIPDDVLAYEQRIAALETERDHLKVEVVRLKGSAWATMCATLQHERNALRAERDALRQPCTHTPPGSDLSCAWCRVYKHLLQGIAKRGRVGVLGFQGGWDAAVQAVREEQG